MSADSYVHQVAPGKPGAPLAFVFHGTGGNESQLLPLGPRAAARRDAGRPARRRRRSTAPPASSAATARASTTWPTSPAPPTRWPRFVEAHIAAARPSRVIGLGYSNGANILASVIFARRDLFDDAVLMHPLIGWEPEPGPVRDPRADHRRRARSDLPAGADPPARRLVRAPRARRPRRTGSRAATASTARRSPRPRAFLAPAPGGGGAPGALSLSARGDRMTTEPAARRRPSPRADPAARRPDRRLRAAPRARRPTGSAPSWRWALRGAFPAIWLTLAVSIAVGLSEVGSAFVVGWLIDLAEARGPDDLFAETWPLLARRDRVLPGAAPRPDGPRRRADRGDARAEPLPARAVAAEPPHARPVAVASSTTISPAASPRSSSRPRARSPTSSPSRSTRSASRSRRSSARSRWSRRSISGSRSPCWSGSAAYAVLIRHFLPRIRLPLHRPRRRARRGHRPGRRHDHQHRHGQALQPRAARGPGGAARARGLPRRDDPLRRGHRHASASG